MNHPATPRKTEEPACADFDKTLAYQQSLTDLQALLEGETDTIAIMASINCVLKMNFPYFFWVGFYQVRNGALIVGPYQGTVGCLHIAFGKGVCGTAAQTRKTQIVPDVNQFPGHIACDSRTRSEIVVPVSNKKGDLIAVFDVDSEQLASFDDTDAQYLELLINRLFAEIDPT